MNRADDDAPWWKSTWRVGRAEWIQFAIAFAAVVVLGALIGLILTDWTSPNAVTELDQRVAEGLAADRTDVRNDLNGWGARLADTPVKIGVTALVVLAMLWRWRRWHEALFVVSTLVFEASAFIVITTIVQRPRPDVPRLLDSPVNSSFPSGHVAAATVYAAVVIVVFWHTRARWARAFAISVAAVVVVIVGFARMYQGMHYLSDVVAGVVLGLVSLALCLRILGRPDNAVDGEVDGAGGDDAESTGRPAPVAPPAREMAGGARR